jgi:LacI family transcriptional regulator
VVTRPTAAVSIRDVAAHAGVSVGTVSNVLNRPELVSEGVKTRVRASIDLLGFVRNEAARQLRMGRSRTVGYVMLDAGNPFFTDVAHGAEDVARESGLTLFMCNSHEDVERERQYLEMLQQLRVHGVLLSPTDGAQEALASLRAQGTPVVLLDGVSSGEDYCSVGVDDVAGGRLSAQHLLEDGHRVVAFAGGPLRLPRVRSAIDDAEAPVRSLVMLETDALNVAAGRGVGDRLLGIPRKDRPTAVICANDLIALGLLQTLTRRGVAVPDEVSIVGYDDIEFAEAAAIPLTSVRQPREELGRTAMQLLLKETEASGTHRHEQIIFTPELVVRESSSRPGHRP